MKYHTEPDAIIWCAVAAVVFVIICMLIAGGL